MTQQAARRRIAGYFCWLMAASLSGEAAELYLMPRVHVSTSVVRLSDVADIRETTEEQRRVLERVELFPAPTNDVGRILRRREIRELLQLRGFDPLSYHFGGASSTHILPSAETPPPIAADTPPILENQAVVSLRALPRGHVLRAVDVELRALPVDPRTGNVRRRAALLTDVAAALGMELLAPLAAGQPLEPGLLRRPILVRRGEVVNVSARAAGVQVATQARAGEDGSLGDLILLQSLTGRDRYSARVTGPQSAEVYASGVTVSPVSQPLPLSQQRTIKERTESRR